jgi:hypothetical protein
MPCDSGFVEGARDGVAEVAADPALEEAFSLPRDFMEAGADIESDGNFGSATLVDGLSSATATKEAYSDSLSPTQVRASHRPPAIPRISRLAGRQCLTALVFLSRGRGAMPEVIFGGGWTGNGFVGRGYTGMGTFSRLNSSANGAKTA